MVFSPTMDNQEEILDALNRFEKKPTDDIPQILEQYLRRVAKTGETLFPWPRVKPLFMNKFEQVAVKFFQEFPADHMSPSPNVENVEFNEMRKRIGLALEAFSGAPFTIQRLCEMLIDPQKHYKRSDKFLRGVEKNVQVISTVDPFGNKIVSESRGLVNGLDSPPNGSGDALPPKQPTYSTFPAPQQTNWPTDSWAGIHPTSENTAITNQASITNSDSQTLKSQSAERDQQDDKSVDTTHPGEESTPTDSHYSSSDVTVDHTSDSDTVESNTQGIATVVNPSHDVQAMPTAPAGQEEGSTKPSYTSSENVSSSDESSEKQFQEQKEITEVSKSSDSAKEEGPLPSSSEESNKTEPSTNALCDSHVTESSPEHEGKEERESQENVQDNKLSEEAGQEESAETPKQEEESKSTDKTDSRVDTNIQDNSTSKNEDVEMTKCCSESTETASAEESRTDPSNTSQDVESSEDKSQDEEMNVDCENGGSQKTSNISDTAQTVVSNTNVSSTVSSETPMEED